MRASTEANTWIYKTSDPILGISSSLPHLIIVVLHHPLSHFLSAVSFRLVGGLGDNRRSIESVLLSELSLDLLDDGAEVGNVLYSSLVFLQ